jgi:hypothetical protein
MFILAETELLYPLKQIGIITITLYQSRNDIFNFYNLEYNFDENIIPLITSVLECQPEFSIRKIYTGIDSQSIIDIPLNNPCENIAKKDYIFGYNPSTSFFIDIENFKNKYSIKNETKKLLSTITYADSNEIVRIYPREQKQDKQDKQDKQNNSLERYIYTQELQVVSWKWSWGEVELIIPNYKENNKKCMLILRIYVIEDHSFISTKVDEVNTTLEKLHKIKSSLNID